MKLFVLSFEDYGIPEDHDPTEVTVHGVFSSRQKAWDLAFDVMALDVEAANADEILTSHPDDRLEFFVPSRDSISTNDSGNETVVFEGGGTEGLWSVIEFELDARDTFPVTFS